MRVCVTESVSCEGCESGHGFLHGSGHGLHENDRDLMEERGGGGERGREERREQPARFKGGLYFRIG